MTGNRTQASARALINQINASCDALRDVIGGLPDGCRQAVKATAHLNVAVMNAGLVLNALRETPGRPESPGLVRDGGAIFKG